MPVTLKTGVMKYRKSDGTYSVMDALMQEPTQEQISAIETAGQEQVDAVEQKGQDILDSLPEDYTELETDVGELKSALDNTIETVGIELTSEGGPNHSGLGSLPHITNILLPDNNIYGDVVLADGINLFDFSGLDPVTKNGVTITPLANNAFVLNGTATGVVLPGFKVITNDPNKLVNVGESVDIYMWATTPIRALIRTEQGQDNVQELKDFEIYSSYQLIKITGRVAVSPIVGYSVVFASTAGKTFDNAIVWLGVYHEGTMLETIGTASELPMTIESNKPVLNTLYYFSDVNYIAKTKDYVDELDVDINDKLTYITPEKFYGGFIPQSVDAAPYISQAIAYGINNSIAVRCNRTYYTQTMLDLQCSALSLYIHELIYSGSDNYAIRITGRYNQIECDYMQSATSGVCLYALGSGSGQYNQSNTIKFGRINASAHAIVFSKPDSLDIVGGLNSFNEITCKYINVQTGNAVRIESGSGGNENIFHGGVLDVNANYAIWDQCGTNEFHNFSFERNTYQGIYLASGGDMFIDCRTIEGEDICAEEGRPFMSVVGSMGTGNIFVGKGSPHAYSIDTTGLTTPAENIGDNENGWQYGLIVSKPVIIGKSSDGRKASYYYSGNKYYSGAGDWAINREGDIIFKLAKPSEIAITTSTFNLNDNTEHDHFIINSINTSITLSHSYCADGISTIFVKQAGGYHATITDAYNNLVFDGSTLGNGDYRIDFVAQQVPYTPNATTFYTWFYGKNSKAVVSRIDAVN